MNAQTWATQCAKAQPLPRTRTEFCLALEAAYLAGQIHATREETQQLKNITPKKGRTL